MAAIQHPHSVITGVSFFYISLVLGCIAGFINILHLSHFSNDIPFLTLSSTPPYFGFWSMLTITILSTIIGWFIISRINKGKNWARYVYAILVLIGLILWTTQFDLALAQGLFALVAAVINTFLGIIGSICLFTPSANAWFKCMGNSDGKQCA